MNKAYEIAKQIANNGEYTLLSDILDELSINWQSTYQLVKNEFKEAIQWNEED